MNLSRPFVIVTLLICVVCGVAYAQEQPYLLGPGDVVEIKVFGQDLNSTVRVDSEGNLSSIPFLDPIPAKCRTEREVQKQIAAAYTRLIKDPQVSLIVTQRNSRQPVSVSGAVRQGGKISMEDRRIRLNELIAASGGFTDKAAGTIQILHTQPLLCPGPGEQAEALPIAGTAVPLQVLKISDLAKGAVNPLIRPGDLVLVTEAEPVYITGSVVSPGGILLRDQLTLSRALGMVGGPRKEANQSEIKIYRQKAGSAQQEIIKVDFEAVKKNKQPDIFLQPYDVIEVGDSGFLGNRGWLEILAGVFTGVLRNPVIPGIP
jgi:polysaccharide export outer membrane protein